MQQSQSGSTGDLSRANPGPAGDTTGSTVRTNDGTETAGDDSGTTATQQSGTIEPSGDPSGSTSTDGGSTGTDGGSTGTDGADKTTTNDIETGSDIEPSSRQK